MTNTDPQAAVLLANHLIPGGPAALPDMSWPMASTVLDPETLAACLAPLADLSASLPGLTPEQCLVAIRAAEPDPAFTRALGTLTDAYYGTDAVQRICRALAVTAPAPASGQWFDPALLKGVLARAEA